MCVSPACCKWKAKASYSLLFLHPDRLHQPFSHPCGYSFLTIRLLASSSSEKKGGSQPCLPADARPDSLGWGTDAAGRGLGGTRSGSRREEFGREPQQVVQKKPAQPPPGDDNTATHTSGASPA
ncbi:high mobility group protein HMGI-C isoform X2 [Cygnus olor]|uniref:high mobility group protein HMGI-C isoform X2 n=1 Tax=Cygnus olor TaxID=8869 RepID=UPI001ADEA232|nr:high mobility group protein HMGI-C isoform X2 [Cygnus olor]